ncbi:MAG TPA: ABC transporter substrate-binding protein [Xanthobacteraceae bacterium]|nr:ABC transporter substrate-binding protein [Xanthobacteraceae bacterium]
MKYRRIIALSLLGAFLAPLAAQAQTKVKMGTVRSTVIGAALAAKERGYFKEAGLDVEIDIIDASAGFVPMLAQNQLQFVEGAITANFFNGVLQGLPVKLAIDTTSSPIGHNLMVRTDLKDQIKTVADLKGKVVGVNAPNSIAAYEVTKILQTGGLDWKDIDPKVIPFPQMGVAFTTKAIDAGLLITPYTAQFPQQKIAEQWIDVDDVAKPQPLSISVSMFNSDWANKNPQAIQGFYTALMRGVHDYCNAYHGGSWRPELLKLLVANGVAPTTELLDRIRWPARNPNGRISPEFLKDVQSWYVKVGVVRSEAPLDAVLDMRYANEANSKIGPFKLENTASDKKGCGK